MVRPSSDAPAPRSIRAGGGRSCAAPRGCGSAPEARPAVQASSVVAVRAVPWQCRSCRSYSCSPGPRPGPEPGQPGGEPVAVASFRLMAVNFLEMLSELPNSDVGLECGGHVADRVRPGRVTFALMRGHGRPGGLRAQRGDGDLVFAALAVSLILDEITFSADLLELASCHFHRFAPRLGLGLDGLVVIVTELSKALILGLEDRERRAVTGCGDFLGRASPRRLEAVDLVLEAAALVVPGLAFQVELQPAFLGLPAMGIQLQSELLRGCPVLSLDALLDLGKPLGELLPFDPAGRLGFLDEAKLVEQEVDRLITGRQLGTQPVELLPVGQLVRVAQVCA